MTGTKSYDHFPCYSHNIENHDPHQKVGFKNHDTSKIATTKNSYPNQYSIWEIIFIVWHDIVWGGGGHFISAVLRNEQDFAHMFVHTTHHGIHISPGGVYVNNQEEQNIHLVQQGISMVFQPHTFTYQQLLREQGVAQKFYRYFHIFSHVLVTAWQLSVSIFTCNSHTCFLWFPFAI
jgi:hypothetical protein